MVRGALLRGLFAAFTFAVWSLMFTSAGGLSGDVVNVIGGLVGVAMLVVLLVVGERQRA